MGDRVYTTLTIKAPEFIPLELSELLEEYFDPGEFELKAGEICEFEDEQANYGRIGCEEELQAMGIAYDLDWCAGSEFGRGIESWRPGMEEPVTKWLMEDGEEAVDASLLWKILDDFDKAGHSFTALNNADTYVPVLKELRSILNTHAPRVPKLEVT